jgi:pSer/pThr/pTyr-binding forkhead associated (FHA) protein
VQIDLIVRKERDPNAYTITCDLADRLVFGRGIGSPVNLSGTEISREHFALVCRDGQICVQDLSSNGTFINGKPVAQRKAQKLTQGDVISVPGYEIEVGGPPPMVEVRSSQRYDKFSNLQNPTSAWRESFTPWEIIVIAAAIASFALIIYYITR